MTTAGPNATRPTIMSIDKGESSERREHKRRPHPEAMARARQVVRDALAAGDRYPPGRGGLTREDHDGAH